MPKQWKTVLVAGILGFFLAVCAAGSILVHPVQHEATPPPEDFPVENVQFPSTSGALIHGWLAAGLPRHGAIMLLHGVRGDRNVMLPRARFLHQLGYTVLLFDFQAHGESLGDSITFGWLESQDVVAAAHYLHTRMPEAPLGAIGISMGGAALLLANQALHLNGVVLESVYPTIEEATADRLRHHLGALGAALTPLLTTQLQWRLHISLSQLHPIDHIAALQTPLLLLHGDQDHHTTLAEAQRLFSSASEPKEMWVVNGAGHVDLYNYVPDLYRTKIADFFARTLIVK
jgi:fermentation-respiration switch protein FrsA (DUF1100 family)